jgi:hypothetical protein
MPQTIVSILGVLGLLVLILLVGEFNAGFDFSLRRSYTAQDLNEDLNQATTAPSRHRGSGQTDPRCGRP